MMTRSSCALVAFALVALTDLGAAFDTTQIPEHPTEKIILQSNQVYDFEWRNVYGDQVIDDNLFECRDQVNVTIRRLVIRDTTQHAIWIRFCHDVLLEYVTLRNTGWGAIRLEQLDPYGGEPPNRNIQMHHIDGHTMGGHGIEYWDTDGFQMSDITVTNSAYCGVLINRCRNGHIGRITGVDNALGTTYATLRFANEAGPNVLVDEVVSRNSARGFACQSGSHGITLKWANIRDTIDSGIHLVENEDHRPDMLDNHVLGGSALNGNPNCHTWRCVNCSIAADVGGMECFTGFPDLGEDGKIEESV